MKTCWSQKIKIGKFIIGQDRPAFIIAEGGINHNGSLRLAKKLIDSAIEANANAIKFQTFITSRVISKSQSPEVFKIIKKYELGPEDFEEIKDYTKHCGIIFGSTPFDISDCNLLSKLSVPFYKIGSGDLDNIPLITHASKQKKPLILSTGMSTKDEIEEALKSITPFNRQIILLHCASVYPTSFEEANLNLIQSLQNKFHILVGYSDHTLGYEASLGAVCRGACVIEKHLTLDNNMKGPDHKTSLNQRDFKAMVKSIRNIESSLGSGTKIILPRERPVRKMARRSLFSVRDIPKGKVIGVEDVDILRPSGGIKPKYLDTVLGKKAKINIRKDQMLKWHMIFKGN